MERADKGLERTLATRLRQILVRHFNQAELQTLCYDLGVEYEDLPGVGKTEKARDLVAYLERRGRLRELVAMGKHLRPRVVWDQPVYDVFLCHHERDRPQVVEVARRLLQAGIRPRLDEWNLLPGDPWPEALQEALDRCASCAFFVGPEGTGPWLNERMWDAVDRRVGSEQDVTGPGFRIIPVLLPGGERGKRGRLPPFLAHVPWVEFRTDLQNAEAFDRLAADIKGASIGAEVEGAPGVDICPYQGLQTFQERHARFFYGRETAVDWLVDELRNRRFLVVIGPSGCGKSSLVRAGLLPALRRGALSGSDRWPLEVLRPGPRPVESLAVALIQATGQTADAAAALRMMDGLANDHRQLHLTARLALADKPDDLCIALVIDQFEEVFTVCQDEEQRAALIANLLYATAVKGGRTVVILTMRADFYGKCAHYPDLAVRLVDHQMLVSPMSEDELRRAIEQPAQLVGMEFEPGLVETMLQEVQGQPGSLPLLQHALLELWEKRDKYRMTHAAYREIGGVAGALKRRADQVYSSFDPPEQEICRHVFLRLTQPGESTMDTKRRAMLRELLPAKEEQDRVERVVQALADANARLITVERSEADHGETVLEVAHEALIQSWPKLREWIEQDRDALRIQRRLAERASEWEQLERDKGSLLRGAQLAEMETWAKRYSKEMNALEHEFLQASLIARRRESRQRVLGRTAVGLSLLVVLVLAVLGIRRFVSGLTGQWTSLGDLETQVNTIAMDPTVPDTLFAGLEDGRVLRAEDRGQTWMPVLTTTHWVRDIAFASNGSRTLYVGTFAGRMFRSDDGGDRWTDLGRVLDAADVKYLAVDLLDPEVLYVVDAEHAFVYRSLDGGTSWSALPVDRDVPAITAISAGVTAEGEPVLYAGSEDGRLWRSTDRGESWHNDLVSEPLAYILDLAVSPVDANVLYALTEEKLHRVEAGSSGQVQDLDSYSLAGRSVAVDPRSPGRIFASTFGGQVYVVQEHGPGDEPRSQQILFGKGLAWALELAAADRDPYYLYAATRDGVFAWSPSRRMEAWFE